MFFGEETHFLRNHERIIGEAPPALELQSEFQPHFPVLWIIRHIGELGMGVHKDYRRLGLGERLAKAVIEKAVENGLERIELEVFASNTAAINLYKKLGFTIEGVHKHGRKIDGKYDDVISMALLIEQG